MARHMTIEERLNSRNEVDEIRSKIPKLRAERNSLKYLISRNYFNGEKAEYLAKINEITEELKTLIKRKDKLSRFLKNSQKSKYNGLFRLQSESYKLLGKSRADFTKEDWRIYDRHMYELRRAKEKKNGKKK